MGAQGSRPRILCVAWMARTVETGDAAGHDGRGGGVRLDAPDGRDTIMRVGEGLAGWREGRVEVETVEVYDELFKWAGDGARGRGPVALTR